MTLSIAIVLGLLLATVVLFATERIPIDIVTILLVIGLIVTGALSVEDAFSGFGDDTVITIAGLFVLTGGLTKTGVIDVLGRRLNKLAGTSEVRLAALVMTAGAGCASIVENTTTTAMLVPVVLGMAERARISPSKVMMPLAFGTILGGTCTLIGTSTNLAVSGALPRYGMAPFSMFELSVVGVPMVVVGIAYMLLIGLRLLPRRAEDAGEFAEKYHIREYMSEIVVLDASPLIGKSLAEANLNDQLDLNVVGILRDAGRRIAPSPNEIIRKGDLLLVQGRIEAILRVKTHAGINIKADAESENGSVALSGSELFEAMVLRGSDFVGRTLRGLKFAESYQLNALAINRHGVGLLGKMSSVALRFGDVLLVQGTRHDIERLTADGQLLLLEDVSELKGRAGKRRWALVAFGLFLVLAITHRVPLSVAVLLGVMVMLASRAVRTQEIYDMIDWRLIVLIAGMISFGVAMEKTGTASYLSTLIKSNFGSYGSLAVLAGFFLMTVAVTQPMSNQAAALVMLPIAIKTAIDLGLNPRAFAVTITLAASCSYLTPLEPACVLVFGPGRYKFLDFVRVGSILTVVIFAVVMLLVPIFWPLR